MRCRSAITRGRSGGRSISANGRDETIARALETGAVDYLVKPFSPTELTARVGAALRRQAGPVPEWGTWPSNTSNAGSPWPAAGWG